MVLNPISVLICYKACDDHMFSLKFSITSATRLTSLRLETFFLTLVYGRCVSVYETIIFRLIPDFKHLLFTK